MHSFTALLALASAVNAHMIMKTPTPAGSPNNSPLDPSGSDYPCKGLTSVADGAVNEMVKGQPNTLSFTGSAVHGGGSCQVSIAVGQTVSKDTKFMVIHSIEGGCPSSNAGNFASDPTASDAGTFQFTIPDHPDIPDGDHTLAWTWHNKIGNREMYMNCANVKISGSGGAKKRYAPASYGISKRQQAPLPEIFKANIGNGCATVESVDTKYPDPGASLEVGSAASLGDPVGSCGSVGASDPSPASSAASSPVASPTAGGNTVSATAPATTGAGSTPITQSEPGNFATVTAPGAEGASATATASSVAVAPSAPAASSTTAASAPLSTSTSSGSSTESKSGPCTDEGAWFCPADGSYFQRCASGSWSAQMQMSGNMKCTPGESQTFAYNVSTGSAKRDLRSHIAKRRHTLHGAALS